MASTGALVFGSPPPRWMTGSPFSRRRAAVSFSLSVADSLMDRASWLRLIGFTFFVRTTAFAGSPNVADVAGRWRCGAICELRLAILMEWTSQSIGGEVQRQ